MSSGLTSTADEAPLQLFHYATPCLIFAVYIVSAIVNVILSARRATRKDEKGDSDAVIPKVTESSSEKTSLAVSTLTAIVTLLYLIESAVLISSKSPSQIPVPDHTIVSKLYCTLVWTVLHIGFADKRNEDPWFPFYNSWLVDLILSVVVFGLELTSTKPPRGVRITQICLESTRFVIVIALLVIRPAVAFYDRRGSLKDEESAPLLAEDHDTSPSNPAVTHSYGATNGTNGQANRSTAAETSTSQGDENADDNEDEEDLNEPGTGSAKLEKHWWLYFKSFALFLPYLWPSGTRRLQLHFLGIIACLCVTRLVNVLIPLQLGLIVNSLADDSKGVPWKPIVLFICLRLLTSSGGVDLIQELLWLPIEKNSLFRLNCSSFEHVMGLSSDFHTSKRSGSMWQTMHRGSSIVSLVRTISFEMGPMIVDLVIAIGVFYWLFDAYMAFIGATVVVIVLYSTQKTINIRSRGQRKFIKLWEAAYNQMTESSFNWITVSYFNRLKHESQSFREAVGAEKKAWFIYRIVAQVITALRGVLLIIGLLAALLLAATQIKYGHRPVGDFVTLITYWAQLGGPLAYLASGFSRIVEYLIDSERLLDLLKKEASVRDKEDAKVFELQSGEVTFDDVKFSYDGKLEVLKGISFNATSGKTIALVGESGGGKSTILKLLFRFYDVGSGSVQIDGQDLRDITQESFREHIGVVPQDVELFNKSILDNLRYAKLDATKEECECACRAVALHDKIMSFPKQYNTFVGERGVKMSGGELQRMAIARVLLKDPKIILLDEATSSVDSETEATIQYSLSQLIKGRTTFVIAHRLSTIINADVVLVIRQGSIAESGTHSELLAARGHYYKLWSHQVKLSSADARSRSRSPKKNSPPVFVNDMKLTITPEEMEDQNDHGGESTSDDQECSSA